MPYSEQVFTVGQILTAAEMNAIDDSLVDHEARILANENDIEAIGNPNLIINGDFNSWQEGTSFAAIANNAMFADLYRYFKTGTMVHTVSQSTDVPTVLQSGHLSNYSVLVDVTTADVALGASDFCRIQYKIEGYDFLKIAQRAFTLGFWVKATKTGIYCVNFRNSGNDRSFVAEYTVNASDTWEYKTIAVTASPSAGTWDYTNGTGLVFEFSLGAGSTFHTTPGAWNTGLFLSTANQVNACDSSLNNFRIAQLQINPGSVALPFVGQSFKQDLAMISRYFQRIDRGATNDPIASGMIFSTGALAEFVFNFVSDMRASPVLAVSNVTHFRVEIPGSTANTTALTMPLANTKKALLTATAAGTTAGQGANLLFGATAGAYIQFDARL